MRISAFGTSRYVAPEALKGGIKVKKTSQDVWSTGVIIYEILFKKLPFPMDEKMKYDLETI